MEKLLYALNDLYGEQNMEVIKTTFQLCQVLNKQGIICLQKRDFEKSYTYLKRAEELSKDNKQLIVTTFNNLACYYRRLGKIRTAYNYLSQALEVELKLPSSISLPDTYLNICAVLSQLDKHEEAINHVYLSIIMLQHQILLKSLGGINLLEINKKSKESIANQSSYQGSFLQSNSKEDLIDCDEDHKKLQERIAVLVVAYYNLGVEMEFQKRDQEAQKIFQQALDIALQNLPKSHKMTMTVKKMIKEQPILQDFSEANFKLNLPGIKKTRDSFKQKSPLYSEKTIVTRNLPSHTNRYNRITPLQNFRVQHHSKDKFFIAGQDYESEDRQYKKNKIHYQSQVQPYLDTYSVDLTKRDDSMDFTKRDDSEQESLQHVLSKSFDQEFQNQKIKSNNTSTKNSKNDGNVQSVIRAHSKTQQSNYSSEDRTLYKKKESQTQQRERNIEKKLNTSKYCQEISIVLEQEEP